VTASAADLVPTDAVVAFAARGWAMRAPIRAAARAALLDTLARAVAGAHSSAVETALAALGTTASRLQAHVLGRTETTSPIGAALLDGIAAGSAESPATAVVCAALAAGESVHAPGAAVLDAIAIGTEIAVRLAASLAPGHRDRGWDDDGTCGRFGAALAAGRILELKPGAVRNALGIAATEAAGLRSAGGTMTASFIRGSAAADGVEAALLARAGFTGAPLALEGRRGLAALMTATFDPAALSAGLDERFTFPAAVSIDEAAVRSVLASVLGDRAAELLALVDRVERLPQIDELVAAACGEDGA
jgi:2-methylcitrate dehydratase PrpD